jgi:hypothetical protein
MSKTTIVDAVKSEAACSTGVTNVSVPIKMDASALAKALQAAANAPQQVVRVNPSELIKESAARMEELYTRFNALKQIGSELHGKALSDPLPATLKLEEISIKFSTVKDGKTSEPIVASVKNVVCIGDIASLLSSELGTIILALQQEAAAIKETATTAEDTCTKARQTWEANNPDRKVVTRDAEAMSVTTVVADSGAQIPASPVTLEGSNGASAV